MPLGSSLLLSDSQMRPEGSDGLLQKGCDYFIDTGSRMRMRCRRVYESVVKMNEEFDTGGQGDLIHGGEDSES